MPTGCNFQFGDCGLEVYRMTKKAMMAGLTDFVVVDGMVDVGGKVLPHTWIKRASGSIVDPTVSQFEDTPVYHPPDEYYEERDPSEYVADFEEQYGTNWT